MDRPMILRLLSRKELPSDERMRLLGKALAAAGGEVVERGAFSAVTAHRSRKGVRFIRSQVRPNGYVDVWPVLRDD